MFTGIIEEVGTLRAVRPGQKSCRLEISADRVLQGTQVGDSICTSGICLTVTSLTPDSFTADVMAETMRRTKLSSLKAGDRVNLERALQPVSRMGGHIVSGHIDGTGIITQMKREDNAVWVTIRTEAQILRYIVEKGSIAIDGISLTVADVDDSSFRVSVIPHTGAQTTLLQQKPGDPVNLECDVIAKYVEKLLKPGDPGKEQKSGGITEAFLQQNGFY